MPKAAKATSDGISLALKLMCQVQSMPEDVYQMSDAK